MVWSRRSRAFSKRRMEGSGSFSRYSENGIISMRNIFSTVVSAWPISGASDSTSALNSVLPTTASVSRIISSEISSVLPDCQRSRTRTAQSLITAAYPASRSR